MRCARLRKWLAETGATTAYIEPASPRENGCCESFNSKMKDEFLNGEVFYSMKEVRVLAERWRKHDNFVLPHSSLGYRPLSPLVPARRSGIVSVEAAEFRTDSFLLLQLPPRGVRQTLLN